MPKTPLILLLLCLTPCSALAGGIWIECARTNISRQEVAATALEGKVYLVGGLEMGERGTIEVYDTYLDEWSLLTELPDTLNHTAVVGLDGRLYILGGYRDRDYKPLTTVLRFDPATLQFETVAPMPKGSGAHTAAVIDGRIYVVGGLPDTKAVKIYDPATDAWSLGTPMPTGREHAASAVIDGHLYVVGGRIRAIHNTRAVLESYDPITDTWTQHAPMPTKRGGLAAAAVGNTLFVFGGEGNDDSVDGTFEQNESWSVETGAWSVEPSMPVPRHGMVAVTVGSRIYIPAGAPVLGLSNTDHTDAFVPHFPPRRRGVRR